MLNISPSRLVRAALGAGAMLALVGVGCAHSAAPKDAAAPKDDWTPSAEENEVEGHGRCCNLVTDTVRRRRRGDPRVLCA